MKENAANKIKDELHMYHCAGGHTRAQMAKEFLIESGFKFTKDGIYWPDGSKLTYNKAGYIDYRDGTFLAEGR